VADRERIRAVLKLASWVVVVGVVIAVFVAFGSMVAAIF
jgi:hypothetical protein